MRFSLFSLILIMWIGVNAQEVNLSPYAFWTYTPGSKLPPTNEDQNLFLVSQVRDSLIAGLESDIIRSFYQVSNGVLYEEIAITYDQNRLFFREDDQWKLLCDFNLQKGDTLTYHIPLNQFAFNIQCGAEPNARRQAKAVVDSVVFFLGWKQLQLRPISEPGYSDWDLGKMTELLSSEYGFFGRSAEPCALDYPGTLRCFQDKYCEEDEGYTFGYQVGDLTCFHVQIADGCGSDNFGLAELVAAEGGIYINPTNEAELPIKIQVFDLSGRSVFVGLLTEKRPVIIPINNWTANIYAVRLLGSTQTSSKKLWLSQ